MSPKENEASNAKDATTSKPLVIVRTFNAPVERVWAAWTEPEQAKKWWGPKDFTASIPQMDFRVGGKAILCMHSPDGKDYYSTGTYKEIVPMKKIVCTDSFSDKDGNIVSAKEYGMGDDFPDVMLVTIEFEDLGGTTKMTLTHAGIPAGEMGDMTNAGWNESFDKLAASLEN